MERDKALGIFFREAKSIVYIVAGSVILALAINMYIDPNKIAPGGLSGVGIVLKHLFGWKIGTIMFILNVPIFLVGTLTIGTRFGWKSFLGTIVLSVAIDSTSGLVSTLTNDLLLASIFGGALSGIGLALVFRAGATTGGTDLIAQILHKFFPFISVGKLLMMCDGCVVLFATVVFYRTGSKGAIELAMYDIITIFITSKLIDIILDGVDHAKAIFIISDNSEEIADELMTKLDRGVTGLDAMGMFKRADKRVLLCVVRRTEVSLVKELTKNIDENAFVILTDVREVLGEGFKAF